MNSSNRNFNPVRLTKTETIIVKVLCLLLAVSVLSSCSTAKQEKDWNDMYEVRSYQIETVTNEIVTTVFLARYVETNKIVNVGKEVEDFGGYEFQPIGEDINVPTSGIEFQCLDGSCAIKE